jgi:hypothetical protein
MGNPAIANLQVEEDSTFPDFSRLFPLSSRLLPTQPANNPSPKRQKQPKTSLSKMQFHVFFFYHTTKNSDEPLNIQDNKLEVIKNRVFINQFSASTS